MHFGQIGPKWAIISERHVVPCAAQVKSHLQKEREKSTVFLPRKHEGTVMPNIATGKNDLGLNTSGRWCRKVPADAGAHTFLPPPNPPYSHHRAHGLHSYWCRWGPGRVSGLRISILLHREQKDIAKSLFVCHLPQSCTADRVSQRSPFLDKAVFQLLRLLANLCRIAKRCTRIYFLTNSMSLLFLRSPISSLLMDEGLQALEQMCRWSLLSKAGDCSAP